MARNGSPSVRERYRIVVHEEVGRLLSAAFADVKVETGEGKTVPIATVKDDQELDGLVDRLRDHGIHIEGVRHDADPE
jgi:hypothetical protein